MTPMMAKRALPPNIVVLMEAIEEREDLIYFQQTRRASESEVIRCRQEVGKLRERLNKKTDYRYSKTGFGSGAVWTEKVGTLYQAVHECDECGTIVNSFMTEQDRNDFIGATKSVQGTQHFYPNEREITRVVRRVE